MGIKTVAVYSDADADARTLTLADEAVRIGPPPGRESLSRHRKDRRRLAKATGAQAVHPGYGFLSRNAAFAHALEEAGIVFIGPSQAIEAMGDKIESKKLARQGQGQHHAWSPRRHRMPRKRSRSPRRSAIR